MEVRSYYAAYIFVKDSDLRSLYKNVKKAHKNYVCVYAPKDIALEKGSSVIKTGIFVSMFEIFPLSPSLSHRSPTIGGIANITNTRQRPRSVLLNSSPLAHIRTIREDNGVGGGSIFDRDHGGHEDTINRIRFELQYADDKKHDNLLDLPRKKKKCKYNRIALFLGPDSDNVKNTPMRICPHVVSIDDSKHELEVIVDVSHNFTIRQHQPIARIYPPNFKPIKKIKIVKTSSKMKPKSVIGLS